MSKVLSATCVNNKVNCESAEVPGVTILSEGVAASTGLLILEDDKKTYVAKTSPDLKTALTQLVSALTQTASALTAVDTMNLATSNIAQINAIASQLSTLKDALK